MRKLLSRRSCSRLIHPAPTEQEFDLIMQAAVRAPDHANLKPWRFLRFLDVQRQKLGEYILQSVEDKQTLDPQSRQKFLNMPLRAPCVLVAYCHYQEHPKVPLVEQQLATGAAITNILHASHQLGYGAIWRTGSICYNRLLHQKLKLQSNETIVGFIYLGSLSAEERSKKPQQTSADWEKYLQDFV